MAGRKRVAPLVEVPAAVVEPTVKRGRGRPAKSAVAAPTPVVEAVESARPTRPAPKYTVQMVALLDAQVGGMLRAAIEHQSAQDDQRTQAVLLREVIIAGLKVQAPKWVKKYGPIPRDVVERNIAESSVKRYRRAARAERA